MSSVATSSSLDEMKANPAHPIWRIEMLGSLQAKADQWVVTRFRTRRVALLLGYLALMRDRVHHRLELAELLWPDQDPEATARNLRQALYSLRRVLEPPSLSVAGVLVAEQSTLQLNPDLVSTDVAEFEGLINRAAGAQSPRDQIESLKAAVSLYKGQLMPGIYEDWIFTERLRLEDLYVFALKRLIDLCSAAELDEEVIPYVRLALAKEPLNEDWHVRLMASYLATGRPSSAVKQYRDLERFLAEQLSSEPSVEAKRLFRKADKASGADLSIYRLQGTEANSPGPESSIDPAPTLSRLPAPLTRFWGRVAEIDQAVRLLRMENARLVTVVGPAGVGKTRLSIEIGTTLVEAHGWDVWFVALADLSSSDSVADAILETMKARDLGRGDWIENVGGVLKGARSLLVLDNFEHVVEHSAAAVSDLVRRLPDLQVLVTSRQALKVEEERELCLAPLPLPEVVPSSRAGLASHLENPCVQLFVDRCRRIRPDFQVTHANAPHIARICAQLEGLPLALEIAAALSSSFAPAQIVQHLRSRLTSFSSRRRDISERHRSLRAAIDYSYELLHPQLRALFSDLCVFRGGFSIESAVAISLAGAEAGCEPYVECLAAVLALQDRSLLGPDQKADSGELRFRMLETFREYGETRLKPDELRQLRMRHAEHFRNRQEQSDHGISKTATEIALRIDADYENYTAAIEFYLQEGEVEKCIDLLAVLQTTWASRGPKMVERSYIRQISDLPSANGLPPDHRILLLRMLGTTYIRSSEFEAAYRACAQALEVAVRHHDERQTAICRTGLSVCAGFLGRMEESLSLNRAVVGYAESVADDPLLAKTYLSIGAAQWSLGQLGDAEISWLAARAASAKARDGDVDPHILSNLATIYLDTGRFDDAMELLGEGMRISQRLHDDFSLSICLAAVSRYHWLKGNQPAALASSNEVMLKRREGTFSFYNLAAIQHHAFLLASSEEWESSVVLLAASHSLSRNQHGCERQYRETALDSARSRLSPESYERAWARGLAMSAEEAFEIAIRFK